MSSFEKSPSPPDETEIEYRKYKEIVKKEIDESIANCDELIDIFRKL